MRESLKAVFEDMDWSNGGASPRSGAGSSLDSTAEIRAALPGLFERHDVKSFLDAPCGDWHWMSHVDLTGIDYIGFDIATSLIEANRAAHTRKGVQFDVADVTSDPLPKVDMMMCRDCLFHLKFWLRWEFFKGFLASGTPLLLTTFHHIAENKPLRNNGRFRKFDPTLPPFNFAPPIEVVHETVVRDEDGRTQLVAGQGGQRSMGLWTREQVADAVARHENSKNEPGALAQKT
jgi:SAM-dependent methyltransferase